MTDRDKHLKCDVGGARVSGRGGAAVAIGPSVSAAHGNVDDLAWMDHVNAGLAFNRAASWVNIGSCFRNAAKLVFPHTTAGEVRAFQIGEGDMVGYVIPGDEPDNEADLLAYRFLMDETRQQRELQRELREYGRAFAVWSENKVYEKVGTETAKKAERHAGR